MTNPSVPSSPISRWPRAGWLLAAAVLAVYFFAPASAVLDVTLDASNYGTYASFTAEGRQYGADVLPMAGPYGFILYGWTYAGQLYWARFGLELLVKAGFALLVLWQFRETAARWMRWLWLLTLLLLPHGVAELVYDLTVLLAGLYLVLNYERRDRLASSCAAAVLLSLLALSKGTLLILTTAMIGLVAVPAVMQRDFRRFVLVAISFAAGLAGWWLAARQNLLHLPAFAHGISELSKGYNEAMAINEPILAFATGCATLVVLELLTLILAWQRRREPAGLAAALLIGAFNFLKWKHGFVRADGHVHIFYQYALAAAPTLWLLLPAPAPGRRLARVLLALLVAATVGLAIYGPGDAPLGRLAWQVRRVLPLTGEAFEAVTHPAATRRDLEQRLAVNRTSFGLPDVQRVVGRTPIDFFGFEHGYLALNGMNYRPRPMGGGSFNVFTPYLQRANAAYVQDPARRPGFYLLSLQTIDNRFQGADDASTLRAVLAGYHPIFAEQGMLLLQANPAPAVPAAPRVLLHVPVRFGESIGLPVVGPDEMVLATFHLPRTLAARFRAAWYKPSQLYLSLSGDGVLEPESRRLVPGLVEEPAIFSPVLERTADLLGLYSREPGKTLRSIRVTAERPQDFVLSELTVTFYAAPRPAPVSADLRAQIIETMKYPMANRQPLAILPPNQAIRIFSGLPVQMLETPGQMIFALGPTDRVVTFDYGMDPECYTRGTTDGVDVFVTLDAPGAAPVQIFRQPLHPLTVPADRGPHHHRLVLPPRIPAGAKLVFHTDPGADGNSAWDWAYFTRVRFESGPHVPDQFPNFNVVADEVEGDYTGALLLGDGRTIFMMNAPGLIALPLDGKARALVFQGGMLEGSYTQGDTDGSDFVVELRRADGRTEELSRRQLRPKTVAADRGPQSISVSLPAHAAGDHLVIRTTAGPGNSNSWDWCYIDGLTLK
ncbi:MAG TPA: hypothetical protein PLB90_03580 [Opitutaceae bacterium]|nr:hypothetical protein [Opitutaceae bacterium]